MRLSLLALACAFASLSYGQVILNDGFDGYPDGWISGNGGWNTASTQYDVVTGGGARPLADSPDKMLTNTGHNTTLLNFIQPSWEERQPGNNILVVECALYVSTLDTTGRSVNVGISSDLGHRLADIGFTNQGDQFFIFSDASGFLSGPAGARDKWHHLKFAMDFGTGKTDNFIDGVSVGTTLFATDEKVNSLYFNSIGDVDSREGYWDSVNVTAVPEPASLLVAPLLLALRRRKQQD